jgi:plasmid stabilization system protein ParE
MNSVRVSSRAAREFDELIAYIAEQDLLIATTVADAVLAAIKRLALDPRMAVATSMSGLRRYPLRKHGITIYVRNRPRKQLLEVVRIVRGKRVKALSRMP